MTPADDGQALWSTGASMIVKADGEATGGAVTLVDLRAAPGYETPYHRHHAEDEYFYVLDGELECHYGDGESLVAGPHDTVFLPRDVPHGFRVVSDEPLRMLAGVTPAGLEAFFVDVGTEVETRELPPPADPDVERVAAVAAEYDLEILGPLPE
jgi:quercetin dioxygenase-like cupin family protein